MEERILVIAQNEKETLDCDVFQQSLLPKTPQWESKQKIEKDGAMLWDLRGQMVMTGSSKDNKLFPPFIFTFFYRGVGLITNVSLP